jgi:hypothetical protein
MAMHNPPHPGEFIIQVYLDPNNLSGRELAGKLGVAASTLNRILTGLGAYPTLTVLLGRMIRTHLRRSRPEKILNVFQRIHLRFFSGLRPCIRPYLFRLVTKAMSDRLLAVSALKWRYAFPRRLAVLRRVGLPCSTTMTSGKPGSM